MPPKASFLRTPEIGLRNIWIKRCPVIFPRALGLNLIWKNILPRLTKVPRKLIPEREG